MLLHLALAWLGLAVVAALTLGQIMRAADRHLADALREDLGL